MLFLEIKMVKRVVHITALYVQEFQQHFDMIMYLRKYVTLLSFIVSQNNNLVKITFD